MQEGELLEAQTNSCSVVPHIIVGDCRSGKTQFLVDRTVDLLTRGEDSSQILVFCASPVARDAFDKRLNKALKAAELSSCCADAVRVTTVREFALELLSNPQAVACTGRKARLLAEYESNIMLEDLKTCGLRPKRLKEMLKFFYKGWTELADDDPTWLYLEEEQGVYKLLTDCLTYMHGYLEPEVSNSAVHALRSGRDICELFGVNHVLVDDYQLISRASQTLVQMLAKKSLWISGDTATCVQVFESYPSLEGFTQLIDVSEDVIYLELQDSCASKPNVQVFNDPHKEIEAAVSFIKDMLNAGTPEGVLSAETEMQGCAKDAVARGIYVASPSRAWARMYERNLESEGIAVSKRFDTHALSGDAREIQKSVASAVLSLLRIIDSEDPAAWRCWLGYGDWLLNSPAFCALRRVDPQGEELSGILELLAASKQRGEKDFEQTLSSVFGETLEADERASLQRICGLYTKTQEAKARILERAGDDLLQEAANAVRDLLQTAQAENDVRLSLSSAEEDKKGGEDAPVPQILLEILDLYSATDALSEDCEIPARNSRPKEGAKDASSEDRVSSMRGSGAAGVINLAKDSLPGKVLGHKILGSDCLKDYLSYVTRALGDMIGFRDDDSLRLGSLEDVLGEAPKTLILTGMVNGFMPRKVYFDEVMTSPQKQEKIKEQDQGLLNAAVYSARENVYITAFTSIDAQYAESLGIKVDRFKMIGGKRTAVVSPSLLLEAFEQ